MFNQVDDLKQPHPQKLCVVSHILPPSPSGQAMVLSRLLAGLSEDSYTLVSREQYRTADNGSASAKLNVPHYKLYYTSGIPLLHKVPSESFKIIVNGLENIFYSSIQLRKIIRKENCRAILACSGDPFDLPAAYLASRYTGIPFIPYFFDDYLYQWTGPHRTLAKMFMRRIMQAAAEIIVPNESLKADYERRYGVGVTVLHNPCKLPDLGELDKHEALLAGNKVNIVYTGSVYHAHYDAFRNLVKAIEMTKSDGIRLHIFTSQRETDLQAEGIYGASVTINPHVHSDDVPIILRQADILFLPLAFGSPIPEVIRTSAPGKTGEYLAAGKPILVHAPHDSFITDYFRTNGCGITVGENDPALLADALLRLINDPALKQDLGNKAREQAEKDFDLVRVRDKFESILKRCEHGG